MPTDKPTFLLRADVETKDALRRAAAADERPMNFKALEYIREGLRRDGYLRPPKKKPKP